METGSTIAAAPGLPPGPAGVLGFFESLGYLGDQVHGLHHARQKYGGILRMPFPGMPMYLVNDPRLIEQVLVTDNKSYVKDRFMRRVGFEVLGQGLLTSDGDFWRRQRRLLQPAFHHNRIAEYADQMVACAQEYASTIQPGQVRDVHRDMMQLTLRIVLRVLLSVESDEITEQISEDFATITERYDISPWTMVRARWKVPIPDDPRFTRALKRVNAAVFDVIRSKRERGTLEGRMDVLDMLLAARDEDGNGVSDEHLRDEVITMFSAGHETTALALTYGFLLLSQHPDVAQKLDAELASVLAGRAPTFADLAQLRYTEAVVLESMRVFPPSWAFGREAIRDCELGGYLVPKGAQVSMSPWVVHRDPETFPEPEVFKPERWLDGLQKRLPRFAYLPFGGGPRQCIGNSFAMIEAALLLATIAQRHRLRVAEQAKGPMRFVLSITLRPAKPLRAQVESV